MSALSRPAARPYDPSEDEALRQAAINGRTYAETAREIDRSEKSVRARTVVLRVKGFIVGYEPTRSSCDKPSKSEAPGVPFTLANDAKLIEATRAEGGFPQAVTLGARTFWVTQTGSAWVHTPEGEMAVAA